MAQNWDYAELSKAAKAAGGPGKYVDMLEQASKDAGKMEMLPWLGVAAVGASLLTAATIKVVDYFKSRKKNNETEIEKAKAEIINGIKEYDELKKKEEAGQTVANDALDALTKSIVVGTQLRASDINFEDFRKVMKIDLMPSSLNTYSWFILGTCIIILVTYNIIFTQIITTLHFNQYQIFITYIN